MRPMSLFESGDSTGQVSLAALFEGEAVKTVFSDMTYKDVVRLICRGGWPASVGLDDAAAMAVPKHYLEAVAESDLARVDGVARDPVKVNSVLRSLARNTATPARPATIHSDVLAAEGHRGEVSLTTVRDYLTALERIFVVEDLPAWRPALRSKSALLVSPVRHLVDPSLAVAALDADPGALRADPETTGLLFESLCVRDLRVYAQAGGGKVFHYRDNKGLEADAVVTAPGNRWGAVEVKLGAAAEDQAAGTLLRLKAKLAGQAPDPAFLMVLSATAPAAHTRGDGVHVVPIDRLGP
jgi:predicted AAA+ superfamily ATPase